MSRSSFNCNYEHTDCFGRHGNFCCVLASPIWKDDCPFYKSQAILAEELATVRKRLLRTGNGCLLTKYI